MFSVSLLAACLEFPSYWVSDSFRRCLSRTSSFSSSSDFARETVVVYFRQILKQKKKNIQTYFLHLKVNQSPDILEEERVFFNNDSVVLFCFSMEGLSNIFKYIY